MISWPAASPVGVVPAPSGTTRSTNVVPNTEAGSTRACTDVGSRRAAGPSSCSPIRTSPFAEVIELTWPMITPRDLTSDPSANDPPALSTTADTDTSSANIPLPKASTRPPRRPITMIPTTARRSGTERSRTAGSTIEAIIMMSSPRDPDSGAAAPEQQRHHHVEEDDADDAGADRATGRLTDRFRPSGHDEPVPRVDHGDRERERQDLHDRQDDVAHPHERLEVVRERAGRLVEQDGYRELRRDVR